MEENHLFGYSSYDTSNVNIGLFHENELASLMTFNANEDSKYELTRFCTKKDYTIYQGGNKLLKYFERKYKPKLIISYIDRRLPEDNFYLESDFILEYYIEPEYFYFNLKEYVLRPSNEFKKHKLKNLLEDFNEDKSETENMYNNGFRKVYNSGIKVYTKHI